VVWSNQAETSHTQLDRMLNPKDHSEYRQRYQLAQEPVNVSSRRRGMSAEDFELARMGTQSSGKRWRHARRVNL
jgi:hypothetical protein